MTHAQALYKFIFDHSRKKIMKLSIDQYIMIQSHTLQMGHPIEHYYHQLSLSFTIIL